MYQWKRFWNGFFFVKCFFIMLLLDLITNNHIINDMKKNLLIIYNNSYKIINMIDFQRRCYTEKDQFDIIIFEKYSEDDIDLNSFWEIDEQTE